MKNKPKKKLDKNGYWISSNTEWLNGQVASKNKHVQHTNRVKINQAMCSTPIEHYTNAIEINQAMCSTPIEQHTNRVKINQTISNTIP